MNVWVVQWCGYDMFDFYDSGVEVFSTQELALLRLHEMYEVEGGRFCSPNYSCDSSDIETTFNFRVDSEENHDYEYFEAGAYEYEIKEQ